MLEALQVKKYFKELKDLKLKLKNVAILKFLSQLFASKFLTAGFDLPVHPKNMKILLFLFLQTVTRTAL